MPLPSDYRASHPLAAAKPTRKIFDAWNSSATGHQRADNNLSGSTSWRESRSRKLGEQFGDATGSGGSRLADTVGAGAEGFGKDGRLENGAWMRGAQGLRREGQMSMPQALGRAVNVQEGDLGEDAMGSLRVQEESDKVKLGSEEHKTKREASTTDEILEPAASHPQILRGLTFYINGSTYPLVSDHKLKRIIAQHGGRLSIHLGRNTVTHVIIGTPNGHAGGGGAGGGLASTKIQKEIAKVRGKGVKFVGVEWILESIKVGKRLPEARFTNLKLATKDQKSVYGMFAQTANAIKNDAHTKPLELK